MGTTLDHGRARLLRTIGERNRPKRPRYPRRHEHWRDGAAKRICEENSAIRRANGTESDRRSGVNWTHFCEQRPENHHSTNLNPPHEAGEQYQCQGGRECACAACCRAPTARFLAINPRTNKACCGRIISKQESSPHASGRTHQPQAAATRETYPSPPQPSSQCSMRLDK